MKYSDKIFKYPAVQYIPLKLKDIVKGNYDYFNKISFKLYTTSQRTLLNNRLKNNQKEINYKINENQLAIFVINGIIDIIMYRSQEVFIICNIKNDSFFLCKITTDYFYKKNLLFTLYNGEDGQKLDRENYIYLKKKRNNPLF